MAVVLVLLLLPIDVDLHVAVLAPVGEQCADKVTLHWRFLLVNLLPGRDVELVEVEDDPLEVLAVLHSVDEVSTDDVFLTIDIYSLSTSLVHPTWYGKG